MSKQLDALKLYFDSQGLTYREFAEILGLSPQTFSNMLNGRDAIGKKRAKLLHDKFGFNMVFLLTGEGSLFEPESPAQNDDNKADQNEKKASICPTPEELMKRIDELTAQLETKREENEWLRSVVASMVPASK